MEDKTCVGIENKQSEEQSFSCGKCSKAFNNFSEFDQHMKVHVTGNQFQCKTCNKTFKYSYKLRNHIRIHTGEKPFAKHLVVHNKLKYRISEYKHEYH